MAFINCDFLSETLGMAMSMNVIIPNEKNDVPISEKKVLYLLHGYSDDNTAWSRYSSIERYANEADMVIVMPNAHKSFYSNLPSGERYYDFIAYETPKTAQKLFGLSDKREKNYIAGLSMGGYGAFKIGLSNPNSYAAIASLSGVMDIEYLISSHDKKDTINILGTTKTNENNCIIKILKKQVNAGAKLPALYQCCGKEDFLYEGNIKFKNIAQSFDIDYTYWETPGIHEWGFWDANIKKIINIFKEG